MKLFGWEIKMACEDCKCSGAGTPAYVTEADVRRIVAEELRRRGIGVRLGSTDGGYADTPGGTGGDIIHIKEISPTSKTIVGGEIHYSKTIVGGETHGSEQQGGPGTEKPLEPFGGP